jgi:hypothetical protein
MDPPSLACGEKALINKAMADRLRIDANNRSFGPRAIGYRLLAIGYSRSAGYLRLGESSF